MSLHKVRCFPFLVHKFLGLIIGESRDEIHEWFGFFEKEDEMSSDKILNGLQMIFKSTVGSEGLPVLPCRLPRGLGG